VEAAPIEEPKGLLNKLDKLLISGIASIEKMLKNEKPAETYSPNYSSVQKVSAEMRGDQYATQDYVSSTPLHEPLRKQKTQIIQPMLSDLHTINQMSIEDSPLDHHGRRSMPR
jgi:hypothetical protein